LGKKGRLHGRQMYTDITRFQVFQKLVFFLNLYSRSNVNKKEERNVFKLLEVAGF
jgi:hypothetical protein